MNNNLIKYIKYDPTKKSHKLNIGHICKMAENKEILIPIFQTYGRWQQQKMVDLYNYQFKGASAVSPLSLNEIKNIEKAIPHVTFIERELIENNDLRGILSVVDGQQRITANYKAFINHQDVNTIVFCVSKAKFLINTGALKKSEIPVGILYNNDIEKLKDFVKFHEYFNIEDSYPVLSDIRQKFTSYDYMINQSEDLDEADQKEWFEVLNNAGTRVSNVQLDLTEMLLKGIDFYKDYVFKVNDLVISNGFEDVFRVKTTEVSVPCAMLNPAYEIIVNQVHKKNFSPIPSDVKTKTLSKLEKHDIVRGFEITLKALERALNFIHKNGLNHPSRLEYISFLTGAFVFIKNKELTNETKHYLNNWYKEIDFSLKGNGARREIFSKLIEDLV